MSDTQNSAGPLPAPAVERPKRRNFQDLVREYVVPYNSLLAVTAFLCLILGYASPIVLATLAIILTTSVVQIIVLDIIARDQLVEWANTGSGIFADVVLSFWPHQKASVLRGAPFWALVMVTSAVVFNTIRITLG